ncbi:GLPGLI family protein [Flavobacterium sp. JP2137]|uniref:GLPGLI family protein n=1 Tax=Flavobacterium sp. JP2137 TaxID=3414510 RepID=UPI003D2FE49B
MKYVIFLALFISGTALQAQSLAVIYKETQNLDRIKKQLNDPKLEALVLEKVRALDAEMKLTVHSPESIYSHISPSASKSNARTVYKNFATELLVSEESILDRAFIIEESLEKPQWTLDNEEKTVCGLLCRKAQNQFGEIAWYSTEIALSDGPSKYYGLPGLILEVETKSKKITAEKIEKSTVEKINMPKGGKKISRAAFKKLKDEKLSEYGVSENNDEIKVIKM